MRRIIIFIILLVFFASVFATTSYAAESISRFHSDISIAKSSQVTVVEVISYDFGSTSHHGIFREIPYRYKNDEDKQFRLDINVISVKDESGKPYPYTSSNSGDNLILKIGDPNETVTGIHNYYLTYTLEGAIRYFSDHDELYWNITGNDWEVPIELATARMQFAGVAPKISANCFTGRIGETEKNCSFRFPNQATEFSTTKTLLPGEGLTAAISFPKGVVAVVEPTPVADNSAFIGIIFLIVFIVGYLLIPLFLFWLWWTKGRDPQIDQTVVRVFDPPKNKEGRPLTPLELGALVDEVIHPRDISAEIVHLAIKKYIIIKENKDTEFRRGPAFSTDSQLAKLAKHEQAIIKALKLDTQDISTLKSLKTSFPSELTKLKYDLYEEMVVGGFFPENPKKVRQKYAVFAGIAFFFFSFLTAIMLVVLSRTMSRRTFFGAKAKQYGLGLKQFLTSQERQLEFQEDKYYLFEKLLPYAIAFGVAKLWAKRFDGFTAYQPDWYEGATNQTFMPLAFTNRLNNQLSSIQSSYTATTTRSSSGFSSGFSGGSSGGGFGGGGGGSW